MGMNRYGIGVFLTSVAALCGCSSNNPSQNAYAALCSSFTSTARLVSITPATGPEFGDQQVTAVLKDFDPGADPAVYLGNKARGVSVTSLSADSVSMSFTTAGSPTPGACPLVVVNSLRACAYLANAYTYRPPVSSAFKTFVAMGASYTAGFQSDSYNEDAQLNGPATWIARQAGAYFPIPLIKMPGLPPEEGLEGLNTNGVFQISLAAIAGALFTITDMPPFFEDPTVKPYNIAIPGAEIEDEVLGPASKTLYASIAIPLSNFLFAPYDNSFSETKDIKPEIVMAKELHPTIIVSTDLYGNDLVTGYVTPYSDFVLYLTQAVSALASTGAQVFLADVPHAFDIPSFQQTALEDLTPCGMTFYDVPIRQIDQAASPVDNCAATFTAGTCAYRACESFVPMDRSIDKFNSEFASVVAPYRNVHIVHFADLAAGKTTLAGQGTSFDAEGFPQYVLSNGVKLKMKHLGGFYSLDDIHLTNAGYAVLASVFIQTINDTLGTDVPLPDLVSIVAQDPLSPPALSNYCSQGANSQKVFCQCVDGAIGATTLTCSTIFY